MKTSMGYRQLTFKDINKDLSDGYIRIDTYKEIQFVIIHDWFNYFEIALNNDAEIKSVELRNLRRDIKKLVIGGDIEDIVKIRGKNCFIIRDKNKNQVIIEEIWNEWLKEAINDPVDIDKLDKIKKKILDSKKYLTNRIF